MANKSSIKTTADAIADYASALAPDLAEVCAACAM